MSFIKINNRLKVGLVVPLFGIKIIKFLYC
jgi:hypothetical protein